MTTSLPPLPWTTEGMERWEDNGGTNPSGRKTSRGIPTVVGRQLGTGSISPHRAVPPTPRSPLAHSHLVPLPHGLPMTNSTMEEEEVLLPPSTLPILLSTVDHPVEAIRGSTLPHSNPTTALHGTTTDRNCTYLILINICLIVM